MARRAYERFVLEGKGERRQKEYYSGSALDSRVLGDDTFVDRMLGQKKEIRGSRVDLGGVIKILCQHYSVEERELRILGKDRRLSEVRGIAAWLVLELGISTLTELGKITGRDVTTLSSAAKRLEIRARNDLKLSQRMQTLLKTASL